MGLQRWLLAFYLASALGTGSSVMTTETQRYTCRTFGSGVVQPFTGQSFYVRSDCPFTLIRFTHSRVECEISIRRDDSGLLVFVEISINKIRTVLQNGSILVEEESVSPPYDHTYQHIYEYGIYTRLRSSLLPLSVTWHDVPGGKDSLWVELNQELSSDMTGLCGSSKPAGSRQQIISESVLAEDSCRTRDPVSSASPVCRRFFSFTLDCFEASTLQHMQLCEENIYGFEKSKSISCAFFREMIQQCGNGSFAWNIWRAATECDKPACPGDLEFVEQGSPFVPSCSNHNLRFSNQDPTSSCVCPDGKVLNDRAAGLRCVSVSSCPCEFAGRSYRSGESRSTKCQSCVCVRGEWQCSENVCPTPCLVEGPFVRTFDGKQYAVPGKCTYVASQGQNWKIIVEFSSKAPAVKSVILQIFQDTYSFSENRVTVGEEEITELHQSDKALVFWQSSMYTQVYTSVGMNMQVQMSPEIQLYITPPGSQKETISGLCGNNNNDTTDDFSTSAGIVENSAQPFALSWSVGVCAVNVPPFCTTTDNEIFAVEKCSVLNDPRGVFAECRAHIPTDHYYTACIQRTCQCGISLQQCLCVALGSYVKACAGLGVVVGDWREATDCTVKCQKNQEFFYDIHACNRTCRSLSGPDPRCGLDEGPVEGCGCPEGTHLSQGHICTSKAKCDCHYYGGTTPPGPVDIDGQKCSCENGELHCSKDCGCRNGKVCVHCSEDPVNTTQKTCDSLSKPTGISVSCESGCYCPSDQYEDHHGRCVPLDDCTCVYSGQVFSAGQRVRTNCKTCVCGRGQWHCKDQPCPGRCQLYGNGHFQTFDSKWFRFDGNCMYTLVEDECGNKNSTFSIRVESVPCCDEALTCSRSIILDLQGKVTLTMSDMIVAQSYHVGGMQEDLQYTVYTVGLYIVISVPNKGITLIWDKHTRVTVELSAVWRNKVCGLCGNFDSNEMNDLQKSRSAVMSSPLTFGNSWKVPPCSDVTTEIFPCERNSYCAAWADRRCMIIKGDTFKDCHLKVDPEPYFHACVQESCSCEFEGKFLGFCTAVAAYAEACSNMDVCINWRTPDLCPVYCDYYNKQGQCSWHYEACSQMLICGRSGLTHKLEGCYPRCSKAAPYYDEHIGKCTELRNCSCYFNDTIIQPGAEVLIQSTECQCQNGTLHCWPPTTTPPSTTAGPPTLPTTTPPSTTAGPTTLPTTTPPSTTAGPTTLPTTTPPSTTARPTTLLTTTPPSTTAGPTEPPTTTPPSTTAGPPTLPTTTPPSTTAGPTTLPTTTPPSTTAGPRTLPTTTPPSTTAGPTTLPTTTPPSTTAGTTEPPTTTPPSTTAGPTTLPTTTPPSTTAGTTEPPTTRPPSTTAGPTTLPTTTLPSTTAGPPTLPTTTPPSTTAGPTTLPTTTPPSTTAGPTTLPTTTPPSTTAGPTTLPTTTPPSTTAGPTTLPTTTPPSTTAGPTTLPTTTPPSTTPGPPTLPTTTPPSTTAGPTTIPTTTPPSTTAGTAEPPTTTPPSTTAGPTTLPTNTPPSTTAGPTPLPTTTPPSTTAGPTILPTTTSPSTTAGPPTLPTITPPSTTARPTTLPTTTPPSTTAGPTTLPTTTPPSTTAGPPTLPTITPPSTTARPTTLPTTTPPSTTAGPTTLPTTTPPSTTAGPTTLPTITPLSTTDGPTTHSTTTPPSTTAGPPTLPTTTPPSTTAGPTTHSTTTPPSTTAGPTTLPTTTPPSTTAGPTTLPTTIPPSTTAGPPTLPTTTPPSTTAGTTEPPTTTPPSTTAGPPTLPTTTPPSTTARPTTLPTTTPPSTTAGPTTLPTITPPSTTAGPPTLPTITPPSTTAGPTTLPTTTPPSTTAGPTILPTTTPPSTTAGPTTLPTITPPSTTARPTTLPTTTPPSTTAGPTTHPTTTPPSTTAGPTTHSTTTPPSTTAGPPTLPTTTPPSTTAGPTTLPTTTPPSTTARPTILPTTTPPSTTAGTTEPPTTTPPSTTAGPPTLPTTTPPSTTARPTILPTTTPPSTTAGTTEPPTTTPPSTTAGPTTLPTTTPPSTTAGPTTLPTTTPPSTTAGPTTLPTTTPPSTTAGPTTLPTTTLPTTTAGPTTLPTTTLPTTTATTTFSPTIITPCECKDLRRKRSWSCNETWVEDCFSKSCVNKKIELTPVVCPEPVIPNCPRQQVRKVWDGCCETWKCDCRCDLYGDPHYITFQGVTFDFLDDCTYILVEERSPRHHLMIAVDNFYCVPGLEGSCVKGIILKYQTSVATLRIIPPLFSVKATLNNMTIEPPYEERGWRFEVTGYVVSIYLPEIRSYVSLSPSYNLVINLAMEHFFNNTQGQCGVCGGGSCIRKGGQIEDDSCCGKTSYDWVYDDPQKPACSSAPKDVPCHRGPSRPPATPCPASSLCELLHHPVFSNCSRFVDLTVKKKSCEFDSCRTGACSSLEQAAEECKKAGFCVDWRRLTQGGCDWKCPAGLVFRECHNKLDDFCYGGVEYPGGSLEPSSAGCFCPSGLKRAGTHSNICVPECRYCKGALGEPRLPGEEWRSGCHLCTCNNQTRTEECFLKPLEPPLTCGPNAGLVKTSCCEDLACLEKPCTYNGKTYKTGDRWKDAAHPCMSFLCNKAGIQTETKVCPTENCPEQDRIWDDQHCCFTCDQRCALKVTSINITIDNCTTIMQMPVCQGQCVSQPRVVLHGDVQMEHKWRCCQEQSSERKSVTLQCSDLSERRYAYKHITSCECRACGILR